MKKTVIFSIAAVLFFLFIVVLITTRETRQRSQETLDTIPSPFKQQVQIPAPQSAPRIDFGFYENTTNLPELPDGLSQYTLQTSISHDEAKRWGETLGLRSYKMQGNRYVTFFNTTPLDASIMVVDLSTGGLRFQSFAEFGLVAEGNTPQEKALYMLEQLGVFDETINCPIAYRKTTISRVTFVECHRDWKSVGAPILGFVGMLNIPESVSLSQLQLGGMAETLSDDPTIVTASLNLDRKARSDDFNTATVGVTDGGYIVSIVSNIRKIVQSVPLSSEDSLTPREALDRITSGEYEFALTIPTGQGSPDLSAVYPNNIANSDNVVITDYIFAYLEKTGTLRQESLAPYYVVRGRALLDSGFYVQFIQALPVKRNERATVEVNVAGLQEQESEKSNSLKLGTFSLNPTGTYTEVSDGILPDISSLTNQCPTEIGNIASTLTFNPIYDLGELGRIGLAFYSNFTNDIATVHYFYLPVPNKEKPDINTILAELERVAKKSYVPREEMKYLLAEWEDMGDCPIRLTGESPTLFFYLPQKSHVTVKPKFELTYSDVPLSTEGLWRVQTDEGGVLINGVLRPHLYYEYQPKVFPKPTSGWVIAREDFPRLVKIIASGLSLTIAEESRLSFELNTASRRIKDPYLFVGYIPASVIDTNLPLELEGNDLRRVRYHFYISGQISSTSVTVPTLTPINRSSPFILELGATSQ